MESVTAWSAPPPQLRLIENEIHVWRATLDCDAAVLLRLDATLAPEEKARAGKFVSAKDRNHFIVARGILRELLGRYLTRPAATVEIGYGSRGKPNLFGTCSASCVLFNVSHSHGLSVYAFALGRSVGVDLEAIRPDFAAEDVAERFFSPQEVEELRSLPPELRTEGFFLCWTRKEAYIKARGEGLEIPLDSFRVTVTPGEPEKLTSEDSARWSLYSFRPATGYVGALVGEGQGWKSLHWQWQP